MQNTNSSGHLSPYGRHPVFRVIPGNPLAVRENPDKGQRQLTLVWSQTRIVAPKVKKVVPQTAAQKWYGRAWQWLNDNGNAMTAILALLTVVVSAGWAVFSASARLGQLEERMSGKDGTGGLVNQIAKIDERLTSVETRLVAIETTLKDIDKYFLQQLKPKAEVLLGTPDVGIFRVLRNEVATDARFSVPFKSPQMQPQKGLLIAYTIVGTEKNHVIMQVLIEEEENGKVTKTLSDRYVQITMPTEVGKKDSYDFTIDLGGGKFTSPVRVELVLLERAGPDNLIFASAVKPAATS